MSSDDGKQLPAKNDDGETSTHSFEDEIYTTGAEALIEAESDLRNYDDVDVDAEVLEVLSQLEGMSIDEVIDRNIDQFMDKIEKHLTENVFADFDKRADEIYEETQRKRLELEEKYRQEQEQFEQDLAALKQQIMDSLNILDNFEEQESQTDFQQKQKQQQKQTHQNQSPQPGFSGNLAKSS